MVVSRFVGLPVSPLFFVLFLFVYGSDVTCVVVLCFRLNSLCLLRFVMVVFFFLNKIRAPTRSLKKAGWEVLHALLLFEIVDPTIIIIFLPAR